MLTPVVFMFSWSAINEKQLKTAFINDLISLHLEQTLLKNCFSMNGIRTPKTKMKYVNQSLHIFFELLCTLVTLHLIN